MGQVRTISRFMSPTSGPYERALSDLVDQLNAPALAERTITVPLRDTPTSTVNRNPWGILSCVDVDGYTTDYYAGLASGSAFSTSALAKNVLYAVPFILDAEFTIFNLAFEVTTLGAGSTARMGLYDSIDDLAGRTYPNNLVIDAGEKVTTSTGVKSTTTSLQLEAGRLYWMVYVCGGTTAPSVRALPAAACGTLLGAQTTGGNTMLTVAFTYAALPQTFPALATQSQASAPALGFDVNRAAGRISTLTIPLWSAKYDSERLRRVRLLAGTTLARTGASRPYTTIEICVTSTAGSRVLGTYDTRAQQIGAGGEVTITGSQPLDMRVALGSQVQARVKQAAWPKSTVENCSIAVDYIIAGQ